MNDVTELAGTEETMFFNFYLDLSLKKLDSSAWCNLSKKNARCCSCTFLDKSSLALVEKA